MLLLDLGNTRLKWVIVKNGQWQQVHALPWSTLTCAEDLSQLWQSQKLPRPVLGACVTTTERRALVEQAIAESGWPAVHWLRSPHHHAGLVNAYRQPEHLGIDRFLAMLAAQEAGYAPCVIASCGSALTLDALDRNGRHLGGQIAPGLDAMLAALQQAAPGLPQAAKGPVADLANDTAQAIQSGACHALAAAIERFIGLASEQMHTTPRLLLCGGSATQLLPLLRVQAVILEDAVLRGMLAWAEHPKSPA